MATHSTVVEPVIVAALRRLQLEWHAKAAEQHAMSDRSDARQDGANSHTERARARIYAECSVDVERLLAALGGPEQPDPPEAPVWYGAEQALAWQAGWSAGFMARDGSSKQAKQELEHAMELLEPVEPEKTMTVRVIKDGVARDYTFDRTLPDPPCPLCGGPSKQEQG